MEKLFEKKRYLLPIMIVQDNQEIMMQHLMIYVSTNTIDQNIYRFI